MEKQKADPKRIDQFPLFLSYSSKALRHLLRHSITLASASGLLLEAK